MEKLPADFLFGVGCSDHQCEAYDSAYPPDVWDWWEQDGKVPQSRGQAVDFWHRYPEHLRLARELGCTTFRFSTRAQAIEKRKVVQPSSRASRRCSGYRCQKSTA